MAFGFAIAAAGLITGALTTAHDGTGFTETWLTIAGLGTGLALPSAMNAALGRLSGERSGSGTALISAVRQVGGTFGVAVLGSVLNSTYRSHLHLTGLPNQAGSAIRENVAVGVAVATRTGSADLLAVVRGAFIHGMDILLACSGGIAAAAAVLALACLPATANHPIDLVRQVGPEPDRASTLV